VCLSNLVALAVAVAVADTPTEPSSQPSTPSWYSQIAVHGYVDVYYAFNANQPPSHDNFFSGVGTTAKRANEISLNLAALDVALNPDPFGFHLIVNYGTGAEVVHQGEPSGSVVGPAVWKFVQQATVAWKVPVGRGLVLDAGIMPAFIGGEVLPSKDNWNYTRNWMGELSPYYLAGARASYAFTDRWAAQVLVVNGWQLIADNNEAKSIGAQVSYNADALSLYVNGFAGPELPHDNDHWRLFEDLVLIVRPLASLQFAVAIDAGNQALPGQRNALWYAGSLYARLQALAWLALAARGELYRDERGIMTGAGQTLGEATLTIELRPTGFLIVKLEGRYDRSSAAVFASHDKDSAGALIQRQDQLLFVLGTVAYF
jgi:hypothetical protein